MKAVSLAVAGTSGLPPDDTLALASRHGRPLKDRCGDEGVAEKNPVVVQALETLLSHKKLRCDACSF
jgi:hypothetical protein